MHNSGIVNEIYLQKSGSLVRAKIGDKITVEPSYTARIWEIIIDVVLKISKYLSDSLNK